MATNRLAMATRQFKIALLQMAVTADKHVNLAKAKMMVLEAARNGASLVALPECFNSPYGTKYFEEYAEEIPNGDTSRALAAMARDSGIYLIGGSIPERRQGKLYNTSTTYNPSGDLIAKYSKMHLFDIDIPGKIKFQESEVLSPGNNFGIIEMPSCKVGVGICYDIRFSELGLWLTKQGCSVLIYPGAFNMTTGPAHWELLQRARAVDNQVYVAAVSPARDEKASYVAWGHSSLVNPWGDVIAKASDAEEIVYGDIDLDYLNSVRQQLPYGYQKRDDVYDLVSKV